jgi:hypothetical protein
VRIWRHAKFSSCFPLADFDIVFIRCQEEQDFRNSALHSFAMYDIGRMIAAGFGFFRAWARQGQRGLRGLIT